MYLTQYLLLNISILCALISYQVLGMPFFFGMNTRPDTLRYTIYNIFFSFLTRICIFCFCHSLVKCAYHHRHNPVSKDNAVDYFA